MGEGWGTRWLGRHAVVAPFGILAATVLLTYLAGGGQWNGWESLKSTASMVDLGVVVYAMIAVTVERGVDMAFWALEQRKKRETERQKLMEERLAEALAEARAEERQKTEDWLVQVAEKEGIPIERLLPPNGDAH